jgi:ribosomal protein L32E
MQKTLKPRIGYRFALAVNIVHPAKLQTFLISIVK